MTYTRKKEILTKAFLNKHVSTGLTVKALFLQTIRRSPYSFIISMMSCFVLLVYFFIFSSITQNKSIKDPPCQCPHGFICLPGTVKCVCPEGEEVNHLNQCVPRSMFEHMCKKFLKFICLGSLGKMSAIHRNYWHFAFYKVTS